MGGIQYLFITPRLSVYTLANHIGVPGSLSLLAMTCCAGYSNKPSNNGKYCLEAPVIDISNYANFPNQIGAEEVIPEELPDNGRSPERVDVRIHLLREHHPSYHSHPRRHKPGPTCSDTTP